MRRNACFSLFNFDIPGISSEPFPEGNLVLVAVVVVVVVVVVVAVLKPLFLPNDISSTPRARPDSSPYIRDTNSMVTHL